MSDAALNASIYVAVMLCGRPHYTSLSARALPRSPFVHVHVFPDRCALSDYLPTLYSPAHIHNLPETQLGPDANSKRAVRTFVQSDSSYQFLLVLDTDGMLARSWAEDARSAMPLTSGVLGLYNSNGHATINRTVLKSVAGSFNVCYKRDIGLFGIMMTRQRAIEALNSSPDPKRPGFDWGFSHDFNKRGISLAVFCNSRVMHYGAFGAHNNPKYNVERELNFIDTANPFYQEALYFQQGHVTKPYSVYIWLYIYFGLLVLAVVAMPGLSRRRHALKRVCTLNRWQSKPSIFGRADSAT